LNTRFVFIFLKNPPAPAIRTVLLALLCLTLAIHTNSQAVPYARTFSRTKPEVELALKDLQAYAGQKLPTVEGFVATAPHPLDKYERAFYQLSIEVLPATSPASTIVQVSAKITAWYVDKDPTKSGYQILPSNGRLELDLLDRVDEKFGAKPAPGTPRSLATSDISVPTPKLNLGTGSNISPSGAPPGPPPGGEELKRLHAAREAEEKHMRELSTELESLEQVKKNQARPQNLVTVKKSGAPVLAHGSADAHVLFKAALNDEFEFLDSNGEWVHVQISGVSRGYILRSALELPEALAAGTQESGADDQLKTKPAAYRVTREETSLFPGDWPALKGKTVKLYTVQPTTQDPKETTARAKLNFATTLMRKFAADLPSSATATTAATNATGTATAPSSSDSTTAGLNGTATNSSDAASTTGGSSPPSSVAVDGVVVIFDSADGGLAAATLPNIQQLSKGSVSEELFWKQSYLDPPETFQIKR
jgi:hypothetical protein